MHFTKQRDKPIYGRRERFRFNVGIYAIAFIPFLLALLIRQLVKPPDLGVLQVILIGVVGGVLLGIYLRVHASRSLERRMRDKCRKIIMRDLSKHPLLGLRPGKEPYRYDGDLDLDIGFLIQEPGRLIFIGDRSTFQLEPPQIARIDLSFPYIEITWHDDQAIPQVVGLRLRGSWLYRESNTRSLHEDLTEWLVDPGLSSWSSSGWGHPPRPEEVEGIPAKQPQWMIFTTSLMGVMITFAGFGETEDTALNAVLAGVIAGIFALSCYEAYRWLFPPKSKTEHQSSGPKET